MHRSKMTELFMCMYYYSAQACTRYLPIILLAHGARHGTGHSIHSLQLGNCTQFPCSKI